MEEYVVLVDDNNNVLGTAPKLATHHSNTPLHRAFSLFLFNKKGELLLQQRSFKKKTWPGMWSNSVCGHPGLEETPLQAAQRRLFYELGIKNAVLFEVLPDYRYRCEKDGIVENEICPVFVGFSDEKIKRNDKEVEEIKWMGWKEWLLELKKNPENYSFWCREETELLNKNPKFQNLLQMRSSH